MDFGDLGAGAAGLAGDVLRRHLDDRLQLSPLAKLVASLAIGAFLVFLLAGAVPAGSMPFTDTLIATVWFAGCATR